MTCVLWAPARRRSSATDSVRKALGRERPRATSSRSRTPGASGSFSIRGRRGSTSSPTSGRSGASSDRRLTERSERREEKPCPREDHSTDRGEQRLARAVCQRERRAQKRAEWRDPLEEDVHGRGHASEKRVRRHGLAQADDRDALDGSQPVAEELRDEEEDGRDGRRAKARGVRNEIGIAARLRRTIVGPMPSRRTVGPANAAPASEPTPPREIATPRMKGESPSSRRTSPDSSGVLQRSRSTPFARDAEREAAHARG